MSAGRPLSQGVCPPLGERSSEKRHLVFGSVTEYKLKLIPPKLKISGINIDILALVNCVKKLPLALLKDILSRSM